MSDPVRWLAESVVVVVRLWVENLKSHRYRAVDHRSGEMSGGGGGGGSSRDDYPSPIKPEPKSRSGDTGGDGSGGGGSNPCYLQEITFINSPVAAVLATLKVGDVLDIDIVQNPRRVVAKDVAGNIAGSITAPFLAQLLLCIDAGYEYEAEILRINGGVCKVEVRSK